jgi:two-component system, LytTR family, sensor histidine kinase AgrC
MSESLCFKYLGFSTLLLLHTQDILKLVFSNRRIKVVNKRLDPGKTIITIIVLNLSQIALIAAVLFYLVGMGGGPGLLANPWIIALLSILLAAIVINSLTAFRNRASLLRTGYQFRLLQDTLSKLELLNKTLRGQRHDFMNHLQVVYSLIEMDEFKSASEYIEKVYVDIQKVSRVLKTSNAAVNAILQAKLLSCEKNGITVEFNVTTQLKDLKIPSWEFCRVLGNLLDNAIYALQGKSNDKVLKIELYEDLKFFYFTVTDNGTSIESQLFDKIFDPGFTTKGDKGEGMGLAISREIIENYGGSISVSSDAQATSFFGRIPRSAPADFSERTPG